MLDTWRGLACLMVVVFHASFNADVPAVAADRSGAVNTLGRWLCLLVANLWIGVPVFFVISGYCIAATSDSQRRRPRPIVEFYLRRFRRIFPPYWILLLLLIGLVAASTAAGLPKLFSEDGDPFPMRILSPAQWIGNLTLTESWRNTVLLGPLRAFKGAPKRFLAAQAWTLCYEEQFYAICGLVLLLAPRRFFAGIACISLCTAGAWLATFTGYAYLTNGLFFDGQWFLFAAGVFVYATLNYRSRARAIERPGLILTVAGLGLVSFFARDAYHGQSFLVGAAFALLLLVLHPWDEPLTRCRVLKPLAFCGRICYSLYLIHWPITRLVGHAFSWAGIQGPWPTLLVTIPSATTLSVGAAWVFFRLVERHFLNVPSTPHIRASRGSC